MSCGGRGSADAFFILSRETAKLVTEMGEGRTIHVNGIAFVRERNGVRRPLLRRERAHVVRMTST